MDRMKQLLRIYISAIFILGWPWLAYAQQDSYYLRDPDRPQIPSDFTIKRFPEQKLISVRLVSGVFKPGFYSVPEDTSLLTMLAFAGGTLKDYDVNRVTIWRGDRPGSVEVDLEK